MYEKNNFENQWIKSLHLEWFIASKDGDVKTVNKLISLGFNVNAVDDDQFDGK